MCTRAEGQGRFVFGEGRWCGPQEDVLWQIKSHLWIF